MPTGHAPSFRSRAIGLAIVVVALAVLASSDALHGVVLRVFEASKQAIVRHEAAGMVLFVVLAALSAMLAFFSSAVLVPAAVFAWGPAVCALLLWIGWMLGGVGSYSLARWLGRAALRVLTPGRSLARYEAYLSRRTPFGVIVLFQLALPSEIPGCVLGIVRYPFARYVTALALVELPYAVGTILLGQSFVERRVAAIVSLGSVAVLAGALAVRALSRRMASHDAARDVRAP